MKLNSFSPAFESRPFIIICILSHDYNYIHPHSKVLHIYKKTLQKIFQKLSIVMIYYLFLIKLF